jgi:hypothetical protein
LTRLGLEPTIYCTRGEHTNHYTTNAVKTNIKSHIPQMKASWIIKIKVLVELILIKSRFLFMVTRPCHILLHKYHYLELEKRYITEILLKVALRTITLISLTKDIFRYSILEYNIISCFFIIKHFSACIFN